jgi:hypothetical protein
MIFIGEIIKLYMPCTPIFKEVIQKNHSLVRRMTFKISSCYNIMDIDVFNVGCVEFYRFIYPSNSIY